MSDAPAPTPSFYRAGPDRPLSPIVIGVPHAGRVYPDALLNAAACPPDRLATLEDPWIDRLVEGAIADGAVAIIARHARAWIDLNRDPRELDPDMLDASPGAVLMSVKVRAGLGLIPRRLGPGVNIYRGRISRDAVRQRIRAEHEPYHAAIAAALAAARAQFGVAVLLDCHSMPPLQPLAGQTAAGLVIGDRYGRSAGVEFGAALAEIAAAAGVTMAFNQPYAGGYTLIRHSAPGQDQHAVQIELSRDLYLDAALRMPGSGFAAGQRLIRDAAAALTRVALGRQSLAAE